MAGRASKRKGADGEREFLNLLSELLQLPEKLARNLEQTRYGGADCVQLPGMAIEVKRHEKLEIAAWWRQAERQAIALQSVPVLAYRQSRKPWRIKVPISWMLNEPGWAGTDETATISIEAFAMLVKARVDLSVEPDNYSKGRADIWFIEEPASQDVEYLRGWNDGLSFDLPQTA